MPGSIKNSAEQFPENVIPLFQNDCAYYKRFGRGAPEAFRIRCKDIYYLSILFFDHENEVRGRGFAAFKSGEQIQFSIDGNGDETVRDRCIEAGERIATTFKTTLEHGTINRQGRFLPVAAG